MVHDAANARPPPAPCRARALRNRKTCSCLARKGDEGGSKGRGRRQSLITHYLDMHVG